MRRASGFVICAQSEIERVRAAYGVPEGKLRKVYYPIDPSIWFPEDRGTARAALGLDQDATIAIYHGLIHMHVKGLDVLLDAWDELFGTDPRGDRRLLILGDGVDSGALAERIRARGREDVVFVNRWHHDRSILRRYLSAADVYVFPSRVDAFGIAVTEAMACGLPVVAAAGRGMADILPGGEESGGIVVPSGDARAFARALGRMMEDKSLRERVGANARRRISEPAFGPAVGVALKEFLFA
jgi:starch synthase